MSTRDSISPERSIFVCYRRVDSSYITDRIYDWLDGEFPEAVFRDVDAIPYGVDFREHIRGVLESCRIMLVVIGPDWLNVASDSGKRRIDEPNDHVRIEIETGLGRPGVIVIPLLVQNATRELVSVFIAVVDSGFHFGPPRPGRRFSRENAARWSLAFRHYPFTRAGRNSNSLLFCNGGALESSSPTLAGGGQALGKQPWNEIRSNI